MSDQFGLYKYTRVREYVVGFYGHDGKALGTYHVIANSHRHAAILAWQQLENAPTQVQGVGVWHRLNDFSIDYDYCFLRDSHIGFSCNSILKTNMHTGESKPLEHNYMG